MILKVIDSLALVCYLKGRSSETMKRAEASSCFAVKIQYKGIFGHVTTYWVSTYVKIVLIVTAANNPISN